ncbi:unnamed protein product [Protopolystoma xenopodis]|uniref:Uncharacterized protein n=1 Tax=Protopolystoma xenopodis TaxID=117903 RepID=A0A448XR70_9PLAT|nr:unnamed protein product [Protopolystoma xenopodis]
MAALPHDHLDKLSWGQRILFLILGLDPLFALFSKLMCRSYDSSERLNSNEDLRSNLEAWSIEVRVCLFVVLRLSTAHKRLLDAIPFSHCDDYARVTATSNDVSCTSSHATDFTIPSSTHPSRVCLAGILSEMRQP